MEKTTNIQKPNPDLTETNSAPDELLINQVVEEEELQHIAKSLESFPDDPEKQNMLGGIYHEGLL